VLVAISIALAVLAAGSNAMATVAQRLAALRVPQSKRFRLGLVWDLLRTPVWLLGIVTVVFAAAFQGAALATGPLVVVQPLFVLELPFALLMACVVFRRGMARSGWYSVAAIVIGLGVAMFSAAPGGGTDQAPLSRWVPALVLCLAAMLVLGAVGFSRPFGHSRAALLGAATAVGYALTAALMKAAADTLDRDGVAAFFTAWQTYAFGAVGACAFLLLEHAMQAGQLIASQPALTLGDATVSSLLGIVLYGETIRSGWWLVPLVLGLGMVAAGVVGLSRQEVLPATPPASELADNPRLRRLWGSEPGLATSR
jgi:drug/metabolite transporter (DMT)-like permease